jgi:outer membrane immunogenic protein
MRKLLAGMMTGASLLALAGAAHADEYNAPRAYERAFSWTGFYIGAQGGAGWGTSDDSINSAQACIGGVCTPFLAINPPGLLRDTYTINGFHGGGTIGYNLQTGPVVLGVEADISGANITGDDSCPGSFGVFSGFPSHCHTRLNSFGTVAGRLGVDYGRTMVFVKAGGAWGNFDRGVDFGPIAVGAPLPVGASASLSETRWGVVVGTGVEHSLWRGWSAKFEYDFMDFGTQNETFHFSGPLLAPVTVNVRADDREQVHVVRFGLNYRFGEDRVAPLK